MNKKVILPHNLRFAWCHSLSMLDKEYDRKYTKHEAGRVAALILFFFSSSSSLDWMEPNKWNNEYDDVTMRLVFLFSIRICDTHTACKQGWMISCTVSIGWFSESGGYCALIMFARKNVCTFIYFWDEKMQSKSFIMRIEWGR